MSESSGNKRAWAPEHLGAALSLGYVALTLVGMTYAWAFYARLGVNILAFADAGDFLLAPVRDPLVIVLATLPVPIFLLYQRFVRRFRGHTGLLVRFAVGSSSYYRHETAWF